MSIDRRGERFRVRVMHNGRKASGTTTTFGRAKMLEADLLLKLGAAASDGTGVTVSMLCEAWLEQAQLSDTYRAEMVRTLGRIPSTFGDRELSSVSARVLELVYREYAAAGVASHAVRRLHEMLGSAFGQAVRWEWMLSNPCRLAAKPPAPPRNITPPDDETVARLVAGAEGVLAVFLELAAWTGARAGEVVGLQWSDILPSDELVIRRSLSYTGASGVRERGTKTGVSGQRRIALQRETIAVLDAWRETQTQLAKELVLPDPKWVVSDDAGVTPWPPYRPTNRFIELRRALGITGVRLHDLRHHHATALLAAGVEPHVVADRLGDDVDTVMRTYRHYVSASDRDAIDRLRR